MERSKTANGVKRSKVESTNISVDEEDQHMQKSAKKTILFTKSLALVDLRLTRPPETLRTRETKSVQEKDATREASRDTARTVVNGTPNRTTTPAMETERMYLSTPERRKREKRERVRVGYWWGQRWKQTTRLTIN